jgi:dTDP-4-amino-4,6-dideoxygalactose transaminase
MNSQHIPLVDLTWQTEEIWDDLHKEISDLCHEGMFIGGSKVKEFESRFASFMQAEHCVGVGNGGDAIELILRALDISNGDEVLIPANTFVATAAAVSRVGAIPIPVDVNENDFLIDASEIESRISKLTKAIIPVHLFGQIADMSTISGIANHFNIPVIEDAAQAHGALQNKKHCGSFGLAAATSFYPGKNLGAFGDGGAVITNTLDIASRVKKLRNYGGVEKYEHEIVGFNSRLDSLQALVLSHKLKRLKSWNELRNIAADTYIEALSSMPNVTLPSINPGNSHVWHLFVVRVPNRDRVFSSMSEDGIGVGIHYPTPFSKLPAYSYLSSQISNCPVAEKLSKDILSLPIYPGITQSQIEQVCFALNKALCL